MRNLGLAVLVVLTAGGVVAAEVLRATRARRTDGWASVTDRL